MIYALENVQTRAVKIGYTRDEASLRKRRSTLQVGSSTKLKLLASGEGSEADEQALHRLLAQFRLKGEWFSDDHWMDPLMENVLALLPHGAPFILGHTEDNLRNFVAHPWVRPLPGCKYIVEPAQDAGVRI